MEERRNDVAIRQATYKALIEIYYNVKVRNTSYKVGDLVLRRNEASQKEHIGRLSRNREGPYQVVEATKTGSYILENMKGS